MQVQGGAVFGEAVHPHHGIHVLVGAHRVADLVLNRAHIHGFHVHPIGGPHAGAHDGGIDRQEQVAFRTGGQQVVESDADSLVLCGDNRGTQIMRLIHAELAARQRVVNALDLVGFYLDIAAQSGRRQIGMHLLFIFNHSNLVVVGTLECGRIGDRDRDVLAEVIFAGSPQPRQGIDELADASRQEISAAGILQSDRRNDAVIEHGGGQRTRAGGIGDGHNGDSVVVGAKRVHNDLIDLERCICRGAGTSIVDRVEQGAVADHNLRRGRIARPRVIQDDVGDLAGGLIPGHVSLSLDAVGAIRQIEIDGGEGITGSSN